MVDAYTTISAAETDADSPWNQSITDKVRQNLDALNSGILASKVITGTGDGNGEIAIDATIDWRDRIINVSGIIVSTANITDAAKYVPGGALDYNISTTKTAQGTDDIKFKAETFYSSQGSAAYDSANAPRISGTSTDGRVVAVWVNSSTGALSIRVGAPDANHDRCAWNLVITYTADLGGH